MKRQALAIAASILAIALPHDRAEARECIDIGGVAIPNFFAEGDGQPIVISATLIGSVQNAAGKIVGQRETATGLEMNMEHYFGRSDGGAIYTQDVGVLTSVPGRPGRFMIEITYDIQQGKSRGTLEGFGGQFKSYGLVDLRDPENMQGLVRYSGQICK
uniref:hypothetical protein n=1 Tax=uncultured Altererythrobacter sp. TaxID=500840 RepID=UPI0026169C25|nr:hypothetical protein [uncultured Altererythrobacter sp.]